MRTRTKPIVLFMIILISALFLGGMPAIVQGAGVPTSITHAEITGTDGGTISTDLDGQTPTGTPTYTAPNGESGTMNPANVFKICNGLPSCVNQSNCRTVVSSTLGAAYNTWLLIGGRYWYIAP